MNENSVFIMVQTVLIMGVPIVFAVVFHEVAHGFVAWLKGDATAKNMGRLTLNPIAHIDPFGTVLLPILFYFSVGFPLGYAKPVPVRFENLPDPKRDMAIIAAAGPLSNILLAITSAVIIKILFWFDPTTAMEFALNLRNMTSGQGSPIMLTAIFAFYVSIKINIVLAVINMIPVPPADGGRVVTGLLPDKQAAQFAHIEPYGLMVLMILLIADPFGLISNTLQPLINGIVQFLMWKGV